MNILMVIDGLRIGGVERRMLSLVRKAEESTDLNFEIIVLSKEIKYGKELESIRAKLHIIERKPNKDPRVFMKIMRICRSFKPDIIHAWGSMSAIYAIPAKVMLNIKMLNGMIMNAPSRIPFKTRLRSRLAFMFSDLIISNSHAGIRAYNPPAKRAVCVYNGFNSDRLTHITEAAVMRQKLGIITEHVIGMIGRFDDDRNYTAYILSATEVLKIRKDVPFLAIGEGRTFEKIRSSVPEEYRGHFIFTGKRDDVESLINILDIGMLLSSLTHREGLSNVIMEYMAMGKPVIATRCGGNGEIVEDEITGYLIPENEINKVVDKILLLLNEPGLRNKMGLAGREVIRNKFTIEKMMDRYIELYQPAIQ